MRLRLHIDGGVRGVTKETTGGPYAGRAAIGFVISDMDGVIVRDGGMLIGQATVNECEYSALITGLYNCVLLEATEVMVYSDSKLVVHQMDGSYKLKATHLLPYRDEAREIAGQFSKVTYNWVPRAQNKQADHITEIFLGKR